MQIVGSPLERSQVVAQGSGNNVFHAALGGFPSVFHGFFASSRL
jgi:hypothetical protein